MRRRDFITLLGGAAAAWPLAARGQARARVVGYLMPYPEDDDNAQTRVRAFRQELARLGWSEGRDVRLDVRWITDNMDRVRAEAADLVRSQPDVIASSGDRVIAVLRRLTSSIPIVAIASDLAGSGFVESLARPGANVTGFSVTEFSVIGKMVETLMQLAPSVSRVGMMYNPDNPVGAVYGRAFAAVAAQLGFQPIDLPVHSVADVERAIANLAEHPNGGFIAPPDVTVIALAKQLTSLAARYRVPALYSASLYVQQGGLASYGPDVTGISQRQASYVDRILRGEKASDLPIQQPTSYQFVINLKTAKALGLTVSNQMQLLADEVIE
jgi:putative ABC transport system substrate-binding protein